MASYCSIRITLKQSDFTRMAKKYQTNEQLKLSIEGTPSNHGTILHPDLTWLNKRPGMADGHNC